MQSTGLTGSSDARIVDYCLTNDFVAVTNNRRDFLRIYGREELHPGLFIILPSVRIAVQRELFALILNALEDRRDLVNCVLEMDRDGGIDIYPWPAED